MTRSSALVLERPSWISARAQLVVTGKNDESSWGEARLGARRLAQLNWNADGQLIHEKPLDPLGQGHGLEIQHDGSGGIEWAAQWVHGKQHGPAIQFDERGRPVLVTYFVRGRGTDIWMSGGKVTEVRELADGQLHGLVRWGNPVRPWEEGHYVHGQRHGIFREWEPDGTLRKGFPRFHVHDARVAQRAYKAAQAKDPSLPAYETRDDSNRRTMPRAVREALRHAKDLRRELALVEQLRRRGGK